MKCTQSAALEKELFDLRSLSPALCILWVLLVISVRNRLTEETPEDDLHNTTLSVDTYSIANHKKKNLIPKKVLKIILHVNVNELHQAKPLLRKQTAQNDYQTAK